MLCAAALRARRRWRNARTRRRFQPAVLLVGSLGERPAARKGAENKLSDTLSSIPEDAWFQPLVCETDGYVEPQITLLSGWSKRYGGNSGLGDTEAKRLLKNWMGELAIVHARGLARCLNSRAARCVYETAVRNGKARGHKLPPSLREIDEFYPPGDCWMGTSSSHRAD